MTNMDLIAGLTTKEIETIRNYAKKFDDIEEIRVFGSRALGSYKEGSDVDLVICGDRADRKVATDLKFEIEEESFLPYFFDVVSYKDINITELKEHIDKFGVLIYSKGWNEVRLVDVGLLQRGISRHRPRYAFHLYGGKYPFIQTRDVKSAGKIIQCYTQTYSEEGLKQSKLWPKGTLCITIAANIAEIGMLGFDACFPDSVLGFISDEKKCSQDFIFYSLKFYKKELLSHADGSVQDNINLGTFDKVKFPLPPLPEQKAIGKILSCLDDKIDLLHRQNKTLEALAETYFRQWFIEEVGEEFIKIGDFAKLENKGVNPCNVQPESILISKLNPKTPRIWAIREDVDKYSVCSTEFQVIKPNESRYYEYLYFLLRSAEVTSTFEMSSSGSHQRIRPAYILEIETPKPDDDKIDLFNSTVKNIMKKVSLNLIQIRTLILLRDTLLPSLISGEVRVKI